MAYWPSMTGSWGVRGAEYQLLIGQRSLNKASDWSVIALETLVANVPSLAPQEARPRALRQCEPLISQYLDTGL